MITEKKDIKSLGQKLAVELGYVNSSTNFDFINVSDAFCIGFQEGQKFAKNTSMEYLNWVTSKGYLPRLDDKILYTKWGWKRQVNQIIWSDWVSDEELFELYIKEQTEK